MTSRLAVVTPFAFPSARGNAVTVERITRGLRERGVPLRVWDLSASTDAEVESGIEAYAPDLIHAFHAYRAGPLALRLARRVEIPLVVTLTGTDANHDLFDPERASAVRRVLEGAASLVAFHGSIVERVAGALPDLRARLVTVPQSTQLDVAAPYDLPALWPLPPDRVLFLLPAGIRMVKNVRLPIPPLERLHARLPAVRLAYAGPVLDPAEGEALLRALETRPWARHLGTVPHGHMGSLLAQSDVVVNASISEGGMPNSVLEALARGRPVLAADIAGNRALVEDGVTGLLFHDERDFEEAAERLARDPALRRRLGDRGRERVERLYPVAREIDGYLAIYRSLARVTTT